MKLRSANTHYVHTYVPVYHSCLIDQRFARALHSCYLCRFSSSDFQCSAIHHGQCRPVQTSFQSSTSPGDCLTLSVNQSGSSCCSSTSTLRHTIRRKQGKAPISFPVALITGKPTKSEVRVLVKNADQKVNLTSKGSAVTVSITSIRNLHTRAENSSAVKVVGSCGEVAIQTGNKVCPSPPYKCSNILPAKRIPLPIKVKSSVDTLTFSSSRNCSLSFSSSDTRNYSSNDEVLRSTTPNCKLLLPTTINTTLSHRIINVTSKVDNNCFIPAYFKSDISTHTTSNVSISLDQNELFTVFTAPSKDSSQLSILNPDGKKSSSYCCQTRSFNNDNHCELNIHVQQSDPSSENIRHAFHNRNDSQQDKVVSSYVMSNNSCFCSTLTSISSNNSPNVSFSTSAMNTVISLPAVSLSVSSCMDDVVTISDVKQLSQSTSQSALGLSAKIKSRDIPPFYFPLGQRLVITNGTSVVDSLLHTAAVEFHKLDKVYKNHMLQITKACGFPDYWKIVLFRAADGDKHGFITLQSFSSMIKRVFSTCHEDASRFVSLAAKEGSAELAFDDLMPLVQDVVDCHPGLSFLLEAPEFHSRYIHTVISRIMFSVNRSWSGRITISELRKSDFLQVLASLQEEDDINRVTDYFSYEHFYVIYCKFWDLDSDHDLSIDKSDLFRHNDRALSTRIIERIFSGAVQRGTVLQKDQMSYKEFVWFLIAEEDKKHPTSIEYWFRCMDLDGDGIISMYEMEYFYDEQLDKMEALGIEKLPFEDCLCQMFDMVRPKVERTITLSDLRRCGMADIFFDTFFNLDKFLEHEQRDPFANVKDVEFVGKSITDWDRYAAEEYDILVADEGVSESTEIVMEDTCHPDGDSMTVYKGRCVAESMDCILQPSSIDVSQHCWTRNLHATSIDDIYDF